MELNCEIYLLGDFNRDLLLDNAYSKQLNSTFARYGQQQLVKVPIRREALLDLIITNRMETDEVEVKNYGISDHMLTMIEFEIKGSKETRVC